MDGVRALRCLQLWRRYAVTKARATAGRPPPAQGVGTKIRLPPDMSWWWWVGVKTAVVRVVLVGVFFLLWRCCYCYCLCCVGVGSVVLKVVFVVIVVVVVAMGGCAYGMVVVVVGT